MTLFHHVSIFCLLRMPSVLAMCYHKRLILTIDSQSEVSLYREDVDLRIQSGQLIPTEDMKQFGSYDHALFVVYDEQPSWLTFTCHVFIFLSSTERGEYRLFPIEIQVDGQDIIMESRHCMHDELKSQSGDDEEVNHKIRNLHTLWTFLSAVDLFSNFCQIPQS